MNAKNGGPLGIAVFMRSGVINVNLRELVAKFGLNSAASGFFVKSVGGSRLP